MAKPTSSSKEEEHERWKAAFTEELLKSEKKMWGEHWEKFKDLARESMSNGVRVTAMDANPDILESEALTVPLSAPFVVDRKKFEEANLQELIYMINNITKNTAAGLRMKTDCIPRGWGQVYSHKTVVRVHNDDARVVIKGRNFMEKLDQLVMQPIQRSCTDPDTSGRVKLKYRSGESQNGWLSFTFPSTFRAALKGGPVRLCFAEFAPQPAFCQEAGIIPPQGRLQFSSQDVPNLIYAECPPCTPERDKRVECEARCEAGYEPVGFERVYCGIVALPTLSPETGRENAEGTLTLKNRFKMKCEPQECPPNSKGKNVPSGCKCSSGYNGKVQATSRPPDYYISSCKPSFSSSKILRSRRLYIQQAEGGLKGSYLSLKNDKRDHRSTWVTVQGHELASTWEVEIVDETNPIDVRLRGTGRFCGGCWLGVIGKDRRPSDPKKDYLIAVNSIKGEDSVNTMWRLEWKPGQVLRANELTEASRFMIVQSGGKKDDGSLVSAYDWTSVWDAGNSRWAEVVRGDEVYWRFVPK